MNEEKCKDIIGLLSKYLFKEYDELCTINLNQVHSIMNILVKGNIPFQLTFREGTRSVVKSLFLIITLSPTITITKVFQLEEGSICTC
ncbi:MAG: hypothetical protein CVU84_14745 [Firmicutes bacterium HGW-Firmicutes-1]|jgi:hypothetical protein|nr:MAG: hypothetical protein CVU84_14745 [Firmicutes bacterium HGW-Firmicutes-1]